MADAATHASPWRRGLLYAGAPAACWYALMVGVGLLLASAGPGLAEAEGAVTTALVDSRTPWWDSATHIASVVANTGTIVATALVFGLALRALYGGWLEPLVLWAGVALQSAMFLLTTLVVSRPRPEVEQRDPAPPTSSFPSGHTGAGTALYLGLALLLAGRVTRRGSRIALVVVLLLVPLAVGASRLYRGMHHPSDVVVGLLNGTAAVLIARFAIFHRVGDDDAAPASARRQPPG